jgi:glucosamine--fructose-6-phosphate aminotransferase (isomerizing)
MKDFNKDKSEKEKFCSNTEEEIYEIPEKLKNAINQRDLIKKIANNFNEHNVKHIYLLGAGTSYHAGFAMSYMFNRITKIPTYTEFSMEFQYLIEPILLRDDCVIGISQSGETKDTIESIRIANKIGCFTIGITNNIESELAKACDFAISLKCDEEKSVLATKTYVSELAILSLLALEIAMSRKTISENEYKKVINELKSIPMLIKEILPDLHTHIKKLSQYFKFSKFCFIIGGGPDYATAMEASLKLKEGSRIFGQAYSTAEFPHGPITLADSDAWILAMISHEKDKRKENLINLLLRIKERKATILGIYEAENSEELPNFIDFGIRVPNTLKDLQPLVMILAVQLLTLEIAKIKGINCDTPKFLTKVSGI